jgi:hypothetical protein
MKLHATQRFNKLFYTISNIYSRQYFKRSHVKVRGPFEKFVDWSQCAAVMQSEAVTVMPSCSGGG